VVAAAAAAPAPPPASPALPPRVGIFRQTALYARRALLQRIKGSSLFVDIAVHIIGGIVIGVVASGGPLLQLPIPPQYRWSCPPGAETRCAAWLRLMAEPMTFYWTMTLCALTVPAAVRAFGAEKEAWWREAFAGASPTAYFAGRVLADVPYFAVTSFMFLAPMVAIAPWRGPVDAMYAICLSMAVFAAALAYALSHLFTDPDSASLVGVVASLLMNLFGGFVPMIGDTAVWAFTRYTARAIVAVEIAEGHEVGALFNDLVPEPHQDADWRRDLGILLAFTTGTLGAAYVLLRRTNKARRGWL
jgi:hypothetical protein